MYFRNKKEKIKFNKKNLIDKYLICKKNLKKNEKNKISNFFL